jgi:hypothetical protein
MKNNHETSKYIISILAVVGIMSITVVTIAYICVIFNLDVNNYESFVKVLLITILIGGTLFIANEIDKISK